MGNNSKKTSSNPDQEFMTALTELSNNNTAKTFDFNAKEAEKARLFQEYMSSTSHQREVADLKAAGLNPVLSANSGAASYSASNASASADTSNVAALANLYMTRMNNNTSMQLGRLNAQVGLASAAATRAAAAQTAAATLGAAATSAAAQRYASDNQKYAQMYSAKAGVTQAQINAAASRYGIDNNANGSWPGMIKWFMKQAEKSGVNWNQWSGDLAYRD